MNTLRARGGKSAGSTGSTAVTPPAEDVPLAGKEVTVKVRILDKPEPTYTDAARKAGVTGTVVLKGVFSSNGEVKNLVVVRALGYGLTSAAARAARAIRFVPASKDGRPVSMFIQLEYNFNLY
jgi:protein TonB